MKSKTFHCPESQIITCYVVLCSCCQKLLTSMLTLGFSFPWEEVRANCFSFHSVKKKIILKTLPCSTAISKITHSRWWHQKLISIAGKIKEKQNHEATSDLLSDPCFLIVPDQAFWLTLWCANPQCWIFQDWREPKFRRLRFPTSGSTLITKV